MKFTKESDHGVGVVSAEPQVAPAVVTAVTLVLPVAEARALRAVLGSQNKCYATYLVLGQALGDF